MVDVVRLPGKGSSRLRGDDIALVPILGVSNRFDGARENQQRNSQKQPKTDKTKGKGGNLLINRGKQLPILDFSEDVFCFCGSEREARRIDIKYALFVPGRQLLASGRSPPCSPP